MNNENFPHLFVSYVLKAYFCILILMIKTSKQLIIT